MARLVARNCGADAAELLVAQLRRVRGRVAVAHLGRAFLEAGVDEAQVGAVLRLGVHARADQVLDRHLHRLAAHPGQNARHPSPNTLHTFVRYDLACLESCSGQHASHL